MVLDNYLKIQPTLLAIILVIVVSPFTTFAQTNGKIMTVNGPVEPAKLGTTLPHEHILVDFIGADKVSKDRYDRDSVETIVKPFLQDLKQAGGQTLIECTPNYLGRDPVLLKGLSQSKGLNLITNTGYYGDEKGKFLPDHVYEETAEQLAKRWIAEWKNGIDGTNVRPGFIKLRVDKAPISEVGRKLLKAAAITHKESGLTIGVHTPDGATALEQLDILENEGIAPEAFIWIHAQNESKSSIHKQVARRGAWVELDGIGPGSADYHMELIKEMKKDGLLHRVLLSQDAGWYRVGEAKGGVTDFDPYTYLLNTFIPRLKNEGFTEEKLEMLTISNPREAFTLHVRKKDS